jgi:hypothetical protein
LLTRVSTASFSTARPGSAQPASSLFCNAKTICTSGVRVRSRCGRSSSTIRSNGTSSWSNAASVLVRTRRRSSVNAGSPVRSARSGTVLTKCPISGSVCGWVRPDTGVPIAKSRMAV